MGLKHSMYTDLPTTVVDQIQALLVSSKILDEAKNEIAILKHFAEDETCCKKTIALFNSTADLSKQLEEIKGQRSEFLSRILDVWTKKCPGFTINPIRGQLEKLFVAMEYCESLSKKDMTLMRNRVQRFIAAGINEAEIDFIPTRLSPPFGFFNSEVFNTHMAKMDLFVDSLPDDEGAFFPPGDILMRELNLQFTVKVSLGEDGYELRYLVSKNSGRTFPDNYHIPMFGKIVILDNVTNDGRHAVQIRGEVVDPQTGSVIRKGLYLDNAISLPGYEDFAKLFSSSSSSSSSSSLLSSSHLSSLSSSSSSSSPPPSSSWGLPVCFAMGTPQKILNKLLGSTVGLLDHFFPMCAPLCGGEFGMSPIYFTCNQGNPLRGRQAAELRQEVVSCECDSSNEMDDSTGNGQLDVPLRVGSARIQAQTTAALLKPAEGNERKQAPKNKRKRKKKQKEDPDARVDEEDGEDEEEEDEEEVPSAKAAASKTEGSKITNPVRSNQNHSAPFPRVVPTVTSRDLPCSVLPFSDGEAQNGRSGDVTVGTTRGNGVECFWLLRTGFVILNPSAVDIPIPSIFDAAALALGKTAEKQISVHDADCYSFSSYATKGFFCLFSLVCFDLFSSHRYQIYSEKKSQF